MTARLIRLADAPVRTWRNGGGRACDLLVWPDVDAWRLQISVADVDVDGPFSHYPGVERWFAVVSGAGVELTIDGVTHPLSRTSEPLRFDGSAATTCRLVDGPTRDLNLMLHRSRGEMQRVVHGRPWRPNAERCGVFTASPGTCRAGTDTTDVPALSLLWFDDAPDTLAFSFATHETPTSAWWLSFTTEAAA